jgi:hypothetical protein
MNHCKLFERRRVLKTNIMRTMKNECSRGLEMLFHGPAPDSSIFSKQYHQNLTCKRIIQYAREYLAINGSLVRGCESLGTHRALPRIWK